MLARRYFLVAAVAMAGMLFARVPVAAAVDPDKAQAFVRSLADRAIEAVRQDHLPQAERSKMLRDILRDGFDIKTIGNFALGIYRRQATPEQIKEFLREFEDYVVYTYSSRLGKFAGEKVEITGTRKAGKSKTDIFVKTEIIREGKKPIPVVWRVREHNGRLRIIDVEIEGTNQILAYKQEFATVIRNRGEGVPGLIAELKKKNASLKSAVASND